MRLPPTWTPECAPKIVSEVIPGPQEPPQNPDPSPLSAFAASVSTISSASLQITADNCGAAPVANPETTGKLEYVIYLGDLPAIALLDHGASASFVNQAWCLRNALSPQPLKTPLALTQFAGQGPRVVSRLRAPVVKFAGKQKPWTFLVAERTPAEIVLGLDFVRKWALCHNPINDHVIAVDPEDTRVVWEAQEVPIMSVRTSPEANAHHIQVVTPEEEMAVFEDRLVTPRPQKKTKSSLIEAEVAQGVLMLSCHSVTANSEVDQQALFLFLEQLDPALRSLTDKFPRVFSAPDKIPPLRDVTHNIRLKPYSHPARRSPFPLGDSKLEAMKTQVAELRDMGWITPSVSPWGAPILFVKKKEGAWRMCVDFRDLNAVTIDDSFPLPRLEMLLHRAGTATVFSKLDLASGFHQIALEPHSRPLTAFRLPEPVAGNTHWEWRVIPFGLKNAPPTFQRAMTAALGGCEGFCTVYIDDILVFSHTKDEHLRHLDIIFHRLETGAYHVRLTKCEFMKEEVEYLGHTLSSHGLSTAPHKVEALHAWQPPLRSAKQVRQFLGLVMWYRNFIPHLATIAAPLFRLTSKRSLIQWSPACAEAFHSIKALVTQAPVLARWERGRKTRVITDTSKVGIAAVLEQQHTQGWRPIAFWSRGMKDAKTRYSTTDREWLAVVEAVSKRWRYFLEDQPFTLLSDHVALERKLHKSTHDPPLNDRQSRWVEALMSFPLTFQHIPGNLNHVADALSRVPLIANSITVIKSIYVGLISLLQIAAEQDPEYHSQINECEKDPRKGSIKEGLIHSPQGCIRVPRNSGIRTFLLSEAHDNITSGHFGEEKTLARLNQHWSWKGDAQDVAAYVKSCVRCQKVKHHPCKPPGLLFPITAHAPGEIITLDFVSKFHPAARTAHQQCLVITDKFSRFVFLEGCSLMASALDTANMFIRRVIPLLGVPRKVISDRGPQFTAALWEEVLSMLGSTRALATAHHPQTDGQSERSVQTIIQLLRTYASNLFDRWEEKLPLFELAINTSINASTKRAPHEILFGRNPATPLILGPMSDTPPEPPPDTEPIHDPVPEVTEDWVKQLRLDLKQIHDQVETNQIIAQDKQKKQYDHNRNSLYLLPGSLILLSTESHVVHPDAPRKQIEKFQGPYVVEKQVHPNAYRLRGLPPSVPKTQNVRFLKPFHPSPARFDGRPMPEVALPTLVDGEIEWEVQTILNHRNLKSGLKYLVQWKNTNQTQWLREHNLANCPDLLHQYHRTHQLLLTPFLLNLSPSEEETNTDSRMSAGDKPELNSPLAVPLSQANSEDHSEKLLVRGGSNTELAYTEENDTHASPTDNIVASSPCHLRQ